VLDALSTNPYVIWVVKKFIALYRGPGNHTKSLFSAEYEDGGTTGGAPPNYNLCMADTSLDGSNGNQVTFQKCGSDGTVWIQEADNNGGNFNFNQYSVDHGGCGINNPGWDEGLGDCMVMTVEPGLTTVSVANPQAPGEGALQDWNP